MSGIKPQPYPGMLAQQDPFAALDSDPFAALDSPPEEPKAAKPTFNGRGASGSFEPDSWLKRAVASVRRGAGDLADAAYDPAAGAINPGLGVAVGVGKTALGMGKGIVESAANTLTPQIGEEQPATIGRGGIYRPAKTVSAENTPGAITQEEGRKAALNTVVNAALPIIPADGLLGRGAVDAAAGMYYGDPEDPIRGAVQGLGFGEAMRGTHAAIGKLAEARAADRFNAKYPEISDTPNLQPAAEPTDVAPAATLPDPRKGTVPQEPALSGTGPVSLLNDLRTSLSDRRTGNGTLPDDMPERRVATRRAPVEAVADPFAALDTPPEPPAAPEPVAELPKVASMEDPFAALDVPPSTEPPPEPATVKSQPLNMADVEKGPPAQPEPPVHDGPYPDVPAIPTQVFRNKQKFMGDPKWAYTSTDDLETYRNELLKRGEEASINQLNGARFARHDNDINIMEGPSARFVPSNEFGQGVQRANTVDRILPKVEAELKGRYNAMTPEELASRETAFDEIPPVTGLDASAPASSPVPVDEHGQPLEPEYDYAMGKGKQPAEPSLFGPEPGQVEQTGLDLPTEKPPVDAVKQAQQVVRDPKEIFAASQGKPSVAFTEAKAFLSRSEKISPQEVVQRPEIQGEQPASPTESQPGQGDVFDVGMGAGKQPVTPAIPPAQGLKIAKLPEAPGLISLVEGRARPLREWPGALKDAITNVFAPRARSADASLAGIGIRNADAKVGRYADILNETNRVLREHINQLPDEQKVAVWDAAENGRPTGDPVIDQHHKILRQMSDQQTKELLDRGILHNTILNYIGRITASTPEEAAQAIGKIYGKRPFEGARGFAKERTFPKIVDVLNAGRVPITYNYVDGMNIRMEEAQNAILKHDHLEAEQAAGRAAKVMDMLGAPVPVDAEGKPWVKMDPAGRDRSFTVFGKPEVEVTHREAFDANVREALESVVQSLGIDHERKLDLKGGPGVWGLARSTGAKIQSKFGGENFILMHELGHALDFQKGIGKTLLEPDRTPRPLQTGPNRGQMVARETASAGRQRIAIAKEMRALADLRFEGNADATSQTFKDYTRNKYEKIANALHAMVLSPERMQQVAPMTYAKLKAILESDPRTKPLLDIQPGLRLGTAEIHQTVDVPGLRTLGHWYAPPDVAPVYHNYTAQGFSGNPIFDAAASLTNSSKQMILGVSGFHLTTTAWNAMANDLSLALEQAGSRAFGKSLLTAAKAPLAPIRLARLGKAVAEEMRNPGGPLAPAVDAMIHEGGYTDAGKSEIWEGGKVRRIFDPNDLAGSVLGGRHGQLMLRSLDQALTMAPRTPGQRIGALTSAALRSIPASLEALTKPLFGHYIPAIKRGATYELVADQLRRLGDNATAEQRQQAMTDAVVQIDKRFGMVKRRGYFLDPKVRDGLDQLLLAPTWTGGTASILASGAKDVAKLPVQIGKRMQGGPVPTMGHDAPFIAANLALTAIAGAIITTALTGKPPEEAKDLLFPPDGTLDANGNKNRLKIGGNYTTGDWRNWMRPDHWGTTAMNKTSPLLNAILDFARNQNYQGDYEHDPNAPLGQQVKEQLGATAEHLFSPISVRNFNEAASRGEGTPQQAAANFFGIVPAPRDVIRSPGENAMHDAIARKGHDILTPQEAKAREQLYQAGKANQQGDRGPLDALRTQGGFSSRDLVKAARARRTMQQQFVKNFEGLSDFADQKRVWDAANEQQRQWIRPMWTAYQARQRQLQPAGVP